MVQERTEPQKRSTLSAQRLEIDVPDRVNRSFVVVYSPDIVEVFLQESTATLSIHLEIPTKTTFGHEGICASLGHSESQKTEFLQRVMHLVCYTNVKMSPSRLPWPMLQFPRRVPLVSVKF